MSAATDQAARNAAQASIAVENGGVVSVAAELARLHAQVATLTARLNGTPGAPA